MLFVRGDVVILVRAGSCVLFVVTLSLNSGTRVALFTCQTGVAAGAHQLSQGHLDTAPEVPWPSMVLPRRRFGSCWKEEARRRWVDLRTQRGGVARRKGAQSRGKAGCLMGIFIDLPRGLGLAFEFRIPHSQIQNRVRGEGGTRLMNS